MVYLIKEILKNCTEKRLKVIYSIFFLINHWHSTHSVCLTHKIGKFCFIVTIWVRTLAQVVEYCVVIGV